jgi:hypothetical protein
MPHLSLKTLGSRRPAEPSWYVPFPPEIRDGGDGGVTLRQIISAFVRQEVAAYNQRQREARLVRILSPEAIDAALAKGKVDLGGKEHPPQIVDDEQAIGTALTGFIDGLYLVLIDEIEKRDLEEQIYLQEESTVLFLRLAMLSG